MGDPFVPGSVEHVAALTITGLTATAVSVLVRRSPEGPFARSVRFGLAALLLAGVGATLLLLARERPLVIWDLLPLHLCDFAIFLGTFALVTRNGVAAELLYFWGCAGTLAAILTPDVATGFPDWRCLAFFGFHGAIVVSAVVLVAGFGLRPRSGAPVRVFLVTNAYAAAVGLVNLAFGTNFLYLREKPQVPTLLDWLGPWPAYILACEVLALTLFLLLDLPFHRSRRVARVGPLG